MFEVVVVLTISACCISVEVKYSSYLGPNSIWVSEKHHFSGNNMTIRPQGSSSRRVISKWRPMEKLIHTPPQ